MLLPPILAEVLMDQIRHRGVRCVPCQTPVDKVAQPLSQSPHGLLVLQNGQVMGLVTPPLLLQAWAEGRLVAASPIADICQSVNPLSVEALTPLSNLLQDPDLFSQGPRPVLGAEGKPIGVLLPDDLRQVLAPETFLQRVRIQDLQLSRDSQILGQTPGKGVAQLLTQSGLEAVVVVTEAGSLLGLVTTLSLLERIAAGQDLQPLTAMDLLLPVASIGLTDSLQVACDRMAATATSTLAVLDEGGRVVGLLLRSQIQALCAPLSLYQSRLNLEQALQEQALQLHQMEQQQAELQQRLSHHESCYRAIVEKAPVGISHADARGQFLQVNQQLCTLLGYTEAELLAKHYQEITHPEDRGKFSDEIQQLTTGAVPFVVLEKRYLHKDGTPIWVQVTLSCLRDPAGPIISDLAIIESIEERKQAETARQLIEAARQRAEAQQRIYLQELATWQRRYESAVLASGQILFEFDIVADRDVWSPNTEVVVGYRPEEMPQGLQAFTHLIHPEDRPAFEQITANDACSSQPYQVEYRFRCRDGLYKWVEERGKTCYDHQGHPLYVIGVIVDVSDRKQAELDLSRAKEAADAANRAKSAFLANMSHELRTPLNIILGFTQILQQDTALAPYHQETLHTILQSGDHLLSLINDVLHVSKIEANHVELKTTEIDLVHFLRSLETMLRVQATARGLKLSIELAEDLPPAIEIDQGKLRQILMNLIGNAIKFTETGWVRLTCHRLPPSASLPLPSHQIGLRFEVKDTGLGISQADLGSIFEPFNQLHCQQRLSEGTGLGLTISRQYAELMGGQITATSEIDQGSTFTLDLPVHPLPSYATGPLALSGSNLSILPGQPQRRVLIADDVAANRLVVARLLEPLQWSLQEATNGQEAVTIWQQWRPDLVWMDLRMPVLDGYEAIRQIRQLEQSEVAQTSWPRRTQDPARQTRIIVMTAGTLEDEVIKSLAVGCDDVVLKPLRKQRLFELLGKHLHLAYAYDPSPQPLVEDLQVGSIALTDLVPRQDPCWVQDIYYAALCCDDAKVQSLLQQLPAQGQPLVALLQPLLHEFQFEDITHLLQPFVE